jgi:hypothetical protein
VIRWRRWVFAPLFCSPGDKLALAAGQSCVKLA